MVDNKHTPTPWSSHGSFIHDSKGYDLANVIRYNKGPANAAHIVKCVNMHDELVDALKKAIEELSEYEVNLSGETYNNPSLNETLKKAGAL